MVYRNISVRFGGRSVVSCQKPHTASINPLLIRKMYKKTQAVTKSNSQKEIKLLIITINFSGLGTLANKFMTSALNAKLTMDVENSTQTPTTESPSRNVRDRESVFKRATLRPEDHIPVDNADFLQRSQEMTLKR